MVTMIRLLTIFSVPLFWITGVSLSQEVNQTPSTLLGKPEEKIQLSCSHNIPSYNIILWYQRSVGDTALKLIGYVYYENPTVESLYQGIFDVSGDGAKEAYLHLLKLRQPEDDGQYFCAASYTSCDSGREAYFGGGTRLTVLDPDISDKAIQPNVTVLTPSIHECKDAKDNKNKKTLVCVATGFYPDHVSVSWKINGENVFDGVGTDNSAVWNNETKYSITSRLRVPAGVWYTDSNEFNCTVLFFNGTEYIPFEASVMGDKAPSTGGMTTENYVKSTQTAKLAYIVFIAKSSLYGFFVVVFVWKLQGKSGKHFT
ncbi:T cell receptor beta chain MC.7.G5-like isoform X1 [Osmerus mordax]|uniref:T cell receptor beta chain MC.7.G5-like isoform X1 n=1 Tax=Osmerus mordax TaxID=8014 RepID=UPI00350FE164